MNPYLIGLMLAWRSEKERAARSPLLAIVQVVCALALIVTMVR